MFVMCQHPSKASLHPSFLYLLFPANNQRQRRRTLSYLGVRPFALSHFPLCHLEALGWKRDPPPPPASLSFTSSFRIRVKVGHRLSTRKSIFMFSGATAGGSYGKLETFALCCVTVHIYIMCNREEVGLLVGSIMDLLFSKPSQHPIPRPSWWTHHTQSK